MLTLLRGRQGCTIIGTPTTSSLVFFFFLGKNLLLLLLLAHLVGLVFSFILFFRKINYKFQFNLIEV